MIIQNQGIFHLTVVHNNFIVRLYSCIFIPRLFSCDHYLANENRPRNRISDANAKRTILTCSIP